MKHLTEYHMVLLQNFTSVTHRIYSIGNFSSCKPLMISRIINRTKDLINILWILPHRASYALHSPDGELF